MDKNKTSIVAVSVVNYDDYLDSYIVKYELKIKSGVIKRRTAFFSYSEGLSKDSDNVDLVNRVKQEVGLFDKGVRPRNWR